MFVSRIDPAMYGYHNATAEKLSQSPQKSGKPDSLLAASQKSFWPPNHFFKPLYLASMVHRTKAPIVWTPIGS